MAEPLRILDLAQGLPTEGNLQIIGIDAPESAKQRDIVNFTVRAKNNGIQGIFTIEATGDFIDSKQIYLGARWIRNVNFSFIMPNNPVSITINTYHWVT